MPIKKTGITTNDSDESENAEQLLRKILKQLTEATDAAGNRTVFARLVAVEEAVVGAGATGTSQPLHVMVQATRDAVESVRPVVVETRSSVRDQNGESALSVAREIKASLGEGLNASVTAIKQSVGPDLKASVGTLETSTGAIKESVGANLKGTVGTLRNFVENDLKATVDLVHESVGADVKAVVGSVKSLVENDLKSAVTDIKGSVGNDLKTSVGSIETSVGSGLNVSVTAVKESVGDGLKGAVTEGRDAVLAAVSGVKSCVADEATNRTAIRDTGAIADAVRGDRTVLQVAADVGTLATEALRQLSNNDPGTLRTLVASIDRNDAVVAESLAVIALAVGAGNDDTAYGLLLKLKDYLGLGKRPPLPQDRPY